MDVTNPATGAVIARVPISSKSDVDEAVQLAKKAQVKFMILYTTREINKENE